MLADKYLFYWGRKNTLCVWDFFVVVSFSYCAHHIWDFIQIALQWVDPWPNFDSCFWNVADDYLPITVKSMCCCCSVANLCLILCEPMDYSRLPCPSLSPGVCSNACPLSQWCHPTISSSVIPFFCLQSSPTWRSFPVSQLFASGGQSIGASASVLPMNIHWMLIW